MTAKEALDIRNNHPKSYFNGSVNPDELAAVIDQALEKQVPKKPIYRWTGDETVIECPCCEKYPFDLSEYEWARNFCGNCGQAIDWSEV